MGVLFNGMMRKFIHYIILGVALVGMISSCSKQDYRNAIPAGSTLLASVNFADDEASNEMAFLKNILKLDEPAKCGLDLTQKVYFFESAEGNFGMCAKVSDEDKLEKYRELLVKDGVMKNGPERDDCAFGVIADKFVAGWNDNAFLVIGPVLSAGQKDVMQQIAQLLDQDADDGMAQTALMERLEMQKGAVAIVAQTDALPQQVASIFSIGAPKDAEPSQIAFAADIAIHDEMLVIDSEPFSANNAIDEHLKDSYSVFRQIGDSYLKSMGQHDFMGLFMNVDGKKFFPVLQQSSSLQALLVGVNQAIDMNAIIKSVNGDMYVGMPQYQEGKMNLTMAAKLGQSAFLNDVSYWKKSVPAGASITDWKENAYSYHSQDVNFHFGVQNYTPLQFYAATDKAAAEKVLKASDDPISDAVTNTIKSKRLAVVMSLGALLPENGGMAMLTLPSLMKVKYIVYTVK